MNLDDYRLNAYRKASDEGNKDSGITAGGLKSGGNKAGGSKPASVSREIRRSAEPGHVPLVHKPVFEKVNSRVGEILAQDHAEQENLEQAKIAARTGIWYSKKVSPSADDVRKAAAGLTSGGLIKVPEQPREPGQQDSIYRRVAKFLVIIGVDEAAKILPHLTEEQTEKIIPEIASIRHVSPEESEQILAEFQTLLDQARESGGVDTARTILTKAYGSEKAESLLEKTVAFPNGKPFDYLADADAARIGVLLNGESEAVQSLVLSQIEPKKAAAVLNAMDEKTKGHIILRLAKMKPVAPAVLESVNKSLHEKLLMQNTENTQNLDGRGVLAQILKRMDPQAETSIIATLSSEDPELGADLRKRLFTEEDIIGADDRFLQNKLHDMDDRDIVNLIRGKSQEFRQKILYNLSRHRGDTILEDEQLNPLAPRAECEKITSQFFADLRRAWECGELRVEGRDDGEIYV